MNISHETIIFNEAFNVPVSRLFQAFSDPHEREIWGAPSEAVEIKIDSGEVRTGSTETGRCGTKGDMQFATHCAYHYVAQNVCIVYSETVRMTDAVIHAALVTVEFNETAAGSTVRITDQITSFVGSDGIEGHRVGNIAALQNLKKMLS